MAKSHKKSADPVQQALRDHKQEWSALTKQFMSNLKGLRQGINGRGDSKVGIPPSKIQDPLPGEVSTLLSALTSQFQTLAGGANSIVSEQSSYSQNRRKKQEKKEEVKKPEISQQKPDTGVDAFLNNVASLEETISKYGSNPLTRMWQYVKSPFSSDKMKAGLLSSASDIFYDLLDLENDVLSLDMESIPTALSKYQSIQYSILAFKKSLEENGPIKPSDKLSEVKPAEEEKPKQEVSGPESNLVNQMLEQESEKQDTQEEMIQVLNEVSKGLMIISGSSLPFQKDVNKIIKLLNKLRSTKDRKKIIEIYKQIETDYDTLLMVVEANLENEKNDIKKQQLKSIIHQASYDTNEIIKLSHNYITRLLKKYWLKLRGSNKTSMHRLAISNSVGIMKNIMQDIMNSLEKGADIPFLINKINLLDPELDKIKHKLSILNMFYSKKFYENYDKEHRTSVHPGGNALLDRIFRGEMQKDLRKSLY